MDTIKEVREELEVANQSKVEGNHSTKSDRNSGSCKIIYLLLLTGSIFLIVIALWAVNHVIKQDFIIPESEIAREKGVGYKTALPASSYWIFESLSDSSDSPDRSKTELFEDDKPLGPAH